MNDVHILDATTVNTERDQLSGMTEDTSKKVNEVKEIGENEKTLERIEYARLMVSKPEQLLNKKGFTYS